MRIKKKWIALFALLCFIVGAAGLGATMNMQPQLGTEDIDLSKTIDGNLVGQLSLHTEIANVNVVPSGNDDIQVRYTGKIAARDRKYANIEVKQSGDTANIEVITTKRFQIGIDVNQLFSLIGTAGEQAKIELALPRKSFKLLKLSTSTGNVSVQAARAEELRIETSTGNVSLESFDGKLTDIQTDTGNVSVPHASSDLNVVTSTGNMKISTDDLRYPMNLKSDTGNIAVQMKAPDAVRVDLLSDTGRTTATIPGMTLDANEKHRVLGSKGGGRPAVKAQSDTGNVTVSVK